MLAIRMQRVGRKGHPEYRVVVQDARLTPTSGRIVAKLGHYNPHTKQTTIDKEKASLYLKNGARPSPRVVRLLLAEKIELPSWVSLPSNDKKRTIRNPEKLRRNQPKEEPAAEAPEAVETADAAEESVEVVSAPEAEAPAEPASVEAEVSEEAPAEA